MHFNKLGFFQEQAAQKRKKTIRELNLLSTNLKNNILHTLLFAYFHRELNSLMRHSNSQKMKMKKRRRLCKLQLTLRKRQIKSCAARRTNHKTEELIPCSQKAKQGSRIKFSL
jgi:exonuclease I